MPVLKDDYDLLRSYVERRDDAAFAELVERHVNMVYAAAVRQVGRNGMADDVVQAVFILLERKAPGMDRGLVMAAWLHKATRFAALNAMKNERRRRQHEQSASALAIAEMNRQRARSVTNANAEWAEGTILLDEGIHQLGTADRAAIVLRYLERRPFAEVAKHLGVSEEAAQMRVGRAVEKLRAFFRRKGVAMSAAAFSAAMDTGGTMHAPAALKGLLLPGPLRAANAMSSHGTAAGLADQTGRSLAFALVRAAALCLFYGVTLAVVIAVLVLQFLSYRSMKPVAPSHGTDHAFVDR